MNMLTNSILMWFLNKQYRKDFSKIPHFILMGFLNILLSQFYSEENRARKRQLIAKP